MIGTIRKHQKWLWLIIIIFMGVSLLLWNNSTYSRGDGSRGGASLGRLEGSRITEDQYVKADREVCVRYFFHNGRFPGQDAARSNFDEQRETYQWLILLHKLDDYGVHVSSQEVASYARMLLNSLDRSGQIDPTLFEQRVLRPQGFSLDDMERFCRHTLELQQLMASLGVAGELFTPAEARSFYEREKQEFASEAVFFNATNYLAAVPVNPTIIEQFFTNQMANYRIPERASVRYVAFPVTNFQAQAEALLKTNLAERVEAQFKTLGTNYQRVAPTPEAARLRIREELIRQQATELAYHKAREFDTLLFALAPAQPANLNLLAKTNGLQVGVTAPFSLKDGPTEIEVGADFIKAAFALSEEQPFANKALPGADCFYIIAFNKHLPSEMPSLAQVREKVTTDYKLGQAWRMANQQAAVLAITLTNGIPQGKTFAAVSQQMGQKPVLLPNISLATQSLPELEERIPLNELKRIVLSTPVGKVSAAEPINEGAIVVHVRSKLPLDEKELQAELPAFSNQLRQRRATEIFDQWFIQQAKKCDIPLNQPRPNSNLEGTPAAKS